MSWIRFYHDGVIKLWCSYSQKAWPPLETQSLQWGKLEKIINWFEIWYHLDWRITLWTICIEWDGQSKPFTCQQSKTPHLGCVDLFRDGGFGENSQTQQNFSTCKTLGLFEVFNESWGVRNFVSTYNLDIN